MISLAVGSTCNTRSVGDLRDPRRVVRLRVIGGSVDLRNDVPKSRDECPPVSNAHPCGHVKCKWHLWMVTGPDRPGRRFPGRPDTNRHSTLRPVMMEWPLPPSCFLEVIERAAAEGWGQNEMAQALGVSSSGFRYLLVKAREKLKERGVALREYFGDGEPKRGILDPEER
jgi:predicted DNA-binding protein (UPF0251 family)